MALRPKFLDPRDWEAVNAVLGRKAAGTPPPGAEMHALAELERRMHAQLPPGPAGPFAIPGWESDAARQARQRRRNVDEILEKHGQRKRPGW